MKRTNGKKLSLNRETLASLTGDDLARVNGGDIGGPSRPTTGTTSLTSKIGCPSRLPTLCPTGDSQISVPTRSRQFCPQGQ